MSYNLKFRKLSLWMLFNLSVVFLPSTANAVVAVALAGDLESALSASQELLTALRGTDSEECITKAKTARQHYKILVGDFSDTPARDDLMGKKLDELLRRSKQSKLICSPEHQATEIQAMEETIKDLEKLLRRVKQSR